MKKPIKLFLFPAVFALGLLGGFFGWQLFNSCRNEFKFINSNLNCELKHVVDKSNPIDLREDLIRFIESAKNKGEITSTSIYFRDLYNGPSLGIDENQDYAGASLLKIPTVLAFLKLQEESTSDILERRLSFTGAIEESEALEQIFKPAKTVQQGDFYTIEELIFYSMAYSDNRSNEVLKASLRSIDPDIDLRLQAFRDLGLITLSGKLDATISVRSYASIFRTLFNASYLSLENSNKILSVLVESTFDEGIAAGVPKGVKVANKFGERFLGEEKQLHDCGIVYYPQNPYLLCIMTRGKDFHELAGIISAVSKIVYEEFDSRRIK